MSQPKGSVGNELFTGGGGVPAFTFRDTVISSMTRVGFDLYFHNLKKNSRFSRQNAPKSQKTARYSDSLDEQNCLSGSVLRFSKVKCLIFFQIGPLLTIFPAKITKIDNLAIISAFRAFILRDTVIPSMNKNAQLSRFYCMKE